MTVSRGRYDIFIKVTFAGVNKDIIALNAAMKASATFMSNNEWDPAVQRRYTGFVRLRKGTSAKSHSCGTNNRSNDLFKLLILVTNPLDSRD